MSKIELEPHHEDLQVVSKELAVNEHQCNNYCLPESGGVFDQVRSGKKTRAIQKLRKENRSISDPIVTTEVNSPINK